MTAVVEREPAAAAVVPLMRGVLEVAAVLVFLAGVQLFPFPLRTGRYFAWTINPSMSAVFLGASYWSALGLELGAARARQWHRARIAAPAVLVFTVVTLVVTLGHFDKLHLDHELPLPTRAVTWAWLAIYSIVPVVMTLGLVAQKRHPTGAPPPSGLPAVVRAVLTVLALLFVGLGVALLMAPDWADGAWPWKLTSLTSGLVGAWLLGLGTAAAHGRLLDDRDSLRPLAITGVTFGVLQTVALARHGDELDWSRPSVVVYVAVLATLTAISAWALLPSSPQSRVTTSEQRSPVTAGR